MSKYFRIIETSPEYPDVLVRYDFDDDGACCVVVSAVGYYQGVEHCLREQAIVFRDESIALYAIHDISLQFAEDFCISHSLTNSPTKHP